ncbi:MAG: hypothetical protein EAZ28_17245 [Oscillatoriales cyanobacterium]|nr:MAG: hypothetical protein EAZ28_17245 [Oscillatoriales cyanobacterium]
MQANISVGAKHDRSQYEMITNNLYAVMLRKYDFDKKYFEWRSHLLQKYLERARCPFHKKRFFWWDGLLARPKI